MSDEKLLAERYMIMAGIGFVNEEAEQVDEIETVEDAFAGGENLANPIDHAKVVSGESNVANVESNCPTTGEVHQSEIVSEAKVNEIIAAVQKLIVSRGLSR